MVWLEIEQLKWLRRDSCGFFRLRVVVILVEIPGADELVWQIEVW